MIQIYWDVFLHVYVYICPIGSVSLENPDWCISQMSSNFWMNKQRVHHPCNGVMSNEKEWNRHATWEWLSNALCSMKAARFGRLHTAWLPLREFLKGTLEGWESSSRQRLRAEGGGDYSMGTCCVLRTFLVWFYVLYDYANYTFIKTF